MARRRCAACARAAARPAERAAAAVPGLFVVVQVVCRTAGRCSRQPWCREREAGGDDLPVRRAASVDEGNRWSGSCGLLAANAVGTVGGGRIPVAAPAQRNNRALNFCTIAAGAYERLLRRKPAMPMSRFEVEPAHRAGRNRASNCWRSAGTCAGRCPRGCRAPWRSASRTRRAAVPARARSPAVRPCAKWAPKPSEPRAPPHRRWLRGTAPSSASPAALPLLRHPGARARAARRRPRQDRRPGRAAHLREQLLALAGANQVEARGRRQSASGWRRRGSRRRRARARQREAIGAQAFDVAARQRAEAVVVFEIPAASASGGPAAVRTAGPVARAVVGAARNARPAVVFGPM